MATLSISIVPLLGVVVHIHDASTQNADAGKLLQIRGWHALHDELGVMAGQRDPTLKRQESKTDRTQKRYKQ